MDRYSRWIDRDKRTDRQINRWIDRSRWRSLRQTLLSSGLQGLLVFSFQWTLNIHYPPSPHLVSKPSAGWGLSHTGSPVRSRGTITTDQQVGGRSSQLWYELSCARCAQKHAVPTTRLCFNAGSHVKSNTSGPTLKPAFVSLLCSLLSGLTASIKRPHWHRWINIY